LVKRTDLLVIDATTAFMILKSLEYDSLLRSRFWGCHATLPQRNGCSHPNNIPFTKLVNHRFRSIFKNVFAPNSPFETCPIRECFLFLYPVVEDVTDKHTDFRLLFMDAEKYQRRLKELSM